jgi:hypothetical protein
MEFTLSDSEGSRFTHYVLRYAIHVINNVLGKCWFLTMLKSNRRT